MSWADRTPPPMPSVDTPDVPAWESDAEMGRECAYFEYDDPRLDCPWKCMPGDPKCVCVTEDDYDHQAALTGSLR